MGYSNDEILKLILEGRVDATVRDLIEIVGTDNFTKITRDAANVALAKGYKEVPQNWRAICSVGTSTDLKTQYIARATDFALLEEVGELQPYNDAAVSEEEISFTIQKYGKMFSLSLELQANDAIGALSNMLQRFGAAAARTINRWVWYTMVDQNPNYEPDTTAMWHADHKNLVASNGLSADHLDIAAAALMNQTAPSTGETAPTSIKLGLVPRYLIVNPTNFAKAQRLMGSQTTPTYGESQISASAGEINPHKGLYEIIVTPWIHAGTGTDWYLAADPSQTEMLTIKFFQGREEPELFEEAPGTGAEFEYDAKRYKARIFFGGDWGDFRGVVKSTA